MSNTDLFGFESTAQEEVQPEVKEKTIRTMSDVKEAISSKMNKRELIDGIVKYIKNMAFDEWEVKLMLNDLGVGDLDSKDNESIAKLF